MKMFINIRVACVMFAALALAFASEVDARKKEKKVRGYDYYFAPRYISAIADGAVFGGGVAEAGIVWKRGMFLGLEMGVAAGTNTSVEPDPSEYVIREDPYYRYPLEGEFHGENMFGYGINIGHRRELAPRLELAYGGFVGIYLASHREIKGRHLDSWNLTYEEDRITETVGLIGPFVKLRWRFLELSYRGVVGGMTEYDGTFTTSRYGSTIEYAENFKLGYINQFMLGLYFETSRRKGK